MEKKSKEGVQEKKSPVPVSVITGFLGAGKTTFLNYVLTERHGKRIAVIQNEYGISTGLEAATIVGKDGKQSLEYYELPNGCLCCNVKGELVSTIELLVEKQESFDYILIETSGMADPGPVATSLWLDEGLESRVILDGVITIVDAMNIGRHLSEKSINSEQGHQKMTPGATEAEKQIAFADRIIINKTDLLAPDQVESLKQKIHAINTSTQILTSTFSKVDLNHVLNIQSFDIQRSSEVLRQTQEVDSHPNCNECQSDPNTHHKHLPHTHTKHDNSVSTTGVIVSGEVVSKKEFERWLGGWLWNERAVANQDIFRVKGVIAVKGKKRKLGVQAVHELFDVKPTEVEWLEGEVKENRMVFIGRGLKKRGVDEVILVDSAYRHKKIIRILSRIVLEWRGVNNCQFQ